MLYGFKLIRTLDVRKVLFRMAVGVELGVCTAHRTPWPTHNSQLSMGDALWRLGLLAPLLLLRRAARLLLLLLLGERRAPALRVDLSV